MIRALKRRTIAWIIVCAALVLGVGSFVVRYQMTHFAFKIDNYAEINQDQKVVYLGDQGLPNIWEGGFPRRQNQQVTLRLAGVSDCGDAEMRSFRVVMDVITYDEPFDPSSNHYGKIVEDKSKQESWSLALGERASLDGYTFRLVGGSCSTTPRQDEGGTGDTMLIVLEEIPDDVTEFPSGDPDIW